MIKDIKRFIFALVVGTILILGVFPFIGKLLSIE